MQPPPNGIGNNTRESPGKFCFALIVAKAQYVTIAANPWAIFDDREWGRIACQNHNRRRRHLMHRLVPNVRRLCTEINGFRAFAN
jgi:hypothetical protein